jgi:cellulose synthase/poly-beta-1,6-N-acetylglucosamine synthase-like glycosyltransferase
MSLIHSILSILLLIGAGAICVPILVFSIECLAAVFTGKGGGAARGEADTQRASVAILIPAHDEELGISAALASILPQLQTDDRVVVVADNCTDATAELARRAGAIVLERFDQERRGKGYALDHGIRFLEASPPDVVVVVDADCHLHEGALAALRDQVIQTQLPAQAVYLLAPPGNPQPGALLSAFAFLTKNLVRPLGASRLGCPCLLTGSGMAFPWRLIQAVPLASGNIVEDMQLGLDLAIAGHPPRLCRGAEVTGELAHGGAANTQRRRWEHGHLQTLFLQVPKLVWSGIAQVRLSLICLALDLCVPPLSLLVTLWGILAVLTLVMRQLGYSSLALVMITGAGLLLGTSVLLAWLRFARRLLPFRTLASVPVYALAKLPLYLGFFVKRQKAWVRTERKPS